MARALVVAKAKLDNNPQYKSIVDHRRPMQTRMAQELHTNAGVPLGPCGIEEAKKFQLYLTEYQINIVSKEYNNKIIYAGPDKDKKIYLYLHNNHYDVITKMPGFFATIVIPVRKPITITKTTCVRMRVNVVGFVCARRGHRLCAATVIDRLKVSNVIIIIKSPEAKFGPSAKV